MLVTGTTGHFDQNLAVTRANGGQNDQMRSPTMVRLIARSLYAIFPLSKIALFIAHTIKGVLLNTTVDNRRFFRTTVAR